MIIQAVFRGKNRKTGTNIGRTLPMVSVIEIFNHQLLWYITINNEEKKIQLVWISAYTNEQEDALTMQEAKEPFIELELVLGTGGYEWKRIRFNTTYITQKHFYLVYKGHRKVSDNSRKAPHGLDQPRSTWMCTWTWMKWRSIYSSRVLLWLVIAKKSLHLKGIENIYKNLIKFIKNLDLRELWSDYSEPQWNPNCGGLPANSLIHIEPNVT